MAVAPFAFRFRWTEKTPGSEKTLCKKLAFASVFIDIGAKKMYNIKNVIFVQKGEPI